MKHGVDYSFVHLTVTHVQAGAVNNKTKITIPVEKQTD